MHLPKNKNKYINLSDFTLTRYQIEVSNKGLNYHLKPKLNLKKRKPNLIFYTLTFTNFKKKTIEMKIGLADHQEQRVINIKNVHNQEMILKKCYMIVIENLNKKSSSVSC